MQKTVFFSFSFPLFRIHHYNFDNTSILQQLYVHMLMHTFWHCSSFVVRNEQKNLQCQSYDRHLIIVFFILQCTLSSSSTVSVLRFPDSQQLLNLDFLPFFSHVRFFATTLHRRSIFWIIFHTDFITSSWSCGKETQSCVFFLCTLLFFFLRLAQNEKAPCV